MAKQSAIQKNINRKTLIDRLSEKRAKLKKVLMNKELPSDGMEIGFLAKRDMIKIR